MLPLPGLDPPPPVQAELVHRSVTSFYSNLVTRPTGRAVRMGVESQLAELSLERQPCLSILDFSQVRVIDYSCADEIIAKLLLRYAGPERPAEVYFLVRGLQEHQEDAVEAVLERHGLLIVAERMEHDFRLLGPSDPFQRRAWTALLQRRMAPASELLSELELSEPLAVTLLTSLVMKRVAVRLPDDRLCSVPCLLRG